VRKILLSLIISIPIAAFVVAVVIYTTQSKKIISPLPEQQPKIKGTDKTDYNVIGFLPHWNLDKWQINTKPFDEIIFFTFDIDQKGNLEKNTIYQKTKTEKFTQLRSKLHQENKKLSFAVRLFEDGEIDKLLSNQTAQNNLINQISSVQKEEGFDGVNIDFEYQNNPTAILKEEFIEFLKKLKQKTNKHVTVDFYSNTIKHGDQEMLGRLAEEIDFLVIMSYDFHRPASTHAGPVAPLRTREGDKSIISTLKIAYTKIPPDKLILAFPLYGYEWYTKDESFGSQALDMPTAMASFNRMEQFVKETDCTIYWDRISGSPWLTYQEGNLTKQIYYEDQRSINLKIDLVEQSQVNGIGFWSLGYEGENQQIWDNLERKLK
jgi:spore germination protein YaaH